MDIVSSKKFLYALINKWVKCYCIIISFDKVLILKYGFCLLPKRPCRSSRQEEKAPPKFPSSAFWTIRGNDEAWYNESDFFFTTEKSLSKDRGMEQWWLCYRNSTPEKFWASCASHTLQTFQDAIIHKTSKPSISNSLSN